MYIFRIVTSKLRMHGTERVNATGTELLDLFGRVQTPDCKGTVEKTNRKTLHFVLWLLTSWESNRGPNENRNSCSESDILLI